MAQFSFRDATRADQAVVDGWMAAEHARRWFGGTWHAHPVKRAWIAQLGGQPVGWAQGYRVADIDDLAVRVGDADAVAFDYLLGEPRLLGQGLGRELVHQLCADVLVREFGDVARILATPDVRNTRSIGLLESCGFTQGLWIMPEGAQYAQVVCSVARSYFDQEREMS
jgi:RimJ/RimL family protein N-acetyltransferase